MICDLRLRVLRQCRLLIPATALAVVLFPYAHVVLHAADGELDPTFGDAGTVTIDFSYNEGGIDYTTQDRVRAVAIQPDGKIVTAGTGRVDFSLRSLVVARTNPDGSLDLTFGNGGRVLTEFPDLEYQKVRAMLIQPDGKIVVGGNAAMPSPSYVIRSLVVRYNSDGSLDTGFGDGGLVLTRFGDSYTDVVDALALQSDGKIVAAGTSSGNLSSGDVALARYNPDGSLDPAFGTDGRVVTTIGTRFSSAGIADVVVQADGRILVAGVWASNFALARYNPNGSLDTTFSDDGVVSTNFAGEDAAYGVALQADEKIVVAGETLDVAGRADFALARYNADGTLDTTFGAGGLVMTDFGGADDWARDVAVQADGKIVIVGSSFLAETPTNRDIAVARYDTNGMLDPMFGVGGLVTTDIAGLSDSGNAVAIQTDGKIVVAGNTFSGVELGRWNFVIVRYESGGGT